MKKLTDYIAEAEQTIAEKAVSQQQQKFMGMVHAMQKGKKIKGASPELKKTARTMGKQDAKDFASTPHKGLPKKVSEQGMAEQGVAEAANRRHYDVTATILNPAFAAWESGQGDENNPPEEELEVGVDYSMSGSYKPATWGYSGGEPEEHPEIDEYTVYDLETGREIENIDDHAHSQIVKAITASAENRSDDYYEGLDEGFSAGNYEDNKKYVVDAATGRVVDGPFDRISEIPLRLMGFDGAHKIKTGAELQGNTNEASVPKIATESLGDTGGTFEHVCKTFSHECKRFKESNGLDLDRDLFHALYDYYFDDMPYGIKKDRDGDSFEWVSNRFRDDLQLGQTSVPAMPQHQGEMDTLRKMAGLPPKIHSAF